MAKFSSRVDFYALFSLLRSLWLAIKQVLVVSCSNEKLTQAGHRYDHFEIAVSSLLSFSSCRFSFFGIPYHKVNHFFLSSFRCGLEGQVTLKKLLHILFFFTVS